MSFGRKRAQRTTDKWKFYRDGANKWRWKYIMQGKTAARAYSSFDRYGDCVRDARRHGYRENAK
jgi:hypothetical protein